MNRSIFFVVFFLCFFLLDFVSKLYVHNNIPVMSSYFPVYPYGGIGVFHDFFGIDFSINHVMNRGAAWGIFSSFQEYLLYGRMVIIGGLLSYLIFVDGSLSRKISLLCILTGAIGNVVDSFVYGHVVDMFHFCFWGHSFAIFNVADSLITCGIAWMLLQSMFSKGSKKTVNAKKKASPAKS